MTPPIDAAPASDPETAHAHGPAGPGHTRVTMTVNGQKRALDLDNRTTLLDALREGLHLTGTKKGCDHGQCGACTVTVNGARINACLSLAVMHEGDQITTIEGVGAPDALDPMQQAFHDLDAFQCGYCTPGQICSARAVLTEIRDGIPSHVTADLSGDIALTEDEIRERMSGNLCRCGAYANIVAAILRTAGQTADDAQSRETQGGDRHGGDRQVDGPMAHGGATA